MKKPFLLALSILFSTISYCQDVSEPHKFDTNISKDACWNKINKWVVDGFYRYQAKVYREDKESGWIVVEGQYIPEMDGTISTQYNMQVPNIDFTLEIKCEEKSYTIAIRELYFSFNTGPVSAFDINNIAVVEASTAELKALTRAGAILIYNNELKQNVQEIALLLNDAQIKANDLSLKRKDRKYYQNLYDQHSAEFRVYAKAYNDMKLFAAHIQREISVYLQ